MKILERQKKYGIITNLPEMEEERKKQRLERFGSTNQDQVCINNFCDISFYQIQSN